MKGKIKLERFFYLLSVINSASTADKAYVTLSGLVFPGFPGFWLFRKNMYRGTYYETFYPQSLICAKYQLKTTEKWKWMAKVDLVIFHVFFLSIIIWSSNACKIFNIEG